MKNLVLTILVSILIFLQSNAQELFIKLTPDSITIDYSGQELHFEIESNIPIDSLIIGPDFANLPDWISQIWVLSSPNNEIVLQVEQNPDSIKRSTKIFATANNCDTTWIRIIQTSKEVSIGINYNFEKFEVYPNPVKDLLKINSNFLCKRICIYNSSGKEIINLKNPNFSGEINLSGLKSGLYFLNFYSKDKVLTKKVIKH